MRTRLLVAVLALPLAAGSLACGVSSGPTSNGAGAGPQDPVAASNAAAPAPTAFADGTYEVGTGAGQVPPGKYKTTAESLCYWSRLKNMAGDNDIITNDIVKDGAPVVVSILKTDAGFKTSGCGTWQKIG